MDTNLEHIKTEIEIATKLLLYGGHIGFLAGRVTDRFMCAIYQMRENLILNREVLANVCDLTNGFEAYGKKPFFGGHLEFERVT